MQRSNNFENYRPTVLLLYIVILSFCLVQNANAACTIPTASYTNIPVSPSVAIPRDTPVGSIIYTSPVVTLSNNQPYFRCDSAGYAVIDNYLGGSTPSAGLYPINNTGLAFKWIQQGFSPFLPSYLIGDQSLDNMTNGFQLVKIGPIQSLPSIVGTLAAIRVPGSGVTLYLNILGSIHFTQPSCTTSNAVSVDMGHQKMSSFTGINSKLPPQLITMNFTCEPNISSIKIRLEPNTSILDNNNGVISLSSSSTAIGVGVQITDGAGKPVSFGKDLPISTTTTELLHAAYYQTKSTIKPGTANTSLTFTMTYQ